MKKLFTIILSAAFVTVMSASIFAADAAPAVQSDTVGKTEISKVKAEIKSQRAEFKEQIAPLRAERKVNREDNLALRDQNKALLSQIKSKLTEIKASESKLDENQKTELKALRAEVKTLKDEIAATKGQIKALIEGNRESLKNMDFDAVQAAFDQIYEIQDLRHDKLQQINTALAEMLSAIS